MPTDSSLGSLLGAMAECPSSGCRASLYRRAAPGCQFPVVSYRALSVIRFRGVVRESETGELPTGGGREEVAIGGADVRGGCDTGASAEDDLRGHELAVVLAEGAGERLVAGVSGVAAGGPLPGRRRTSVGGLRWKLREWGGGSWIRACWRGLPMESCVPLRAKCGGSSLRSE